MRLLAFDTSGPASVVALVEDLTASGSVAGQRVLAEDDSPSVGRARHAEVLLPRIEAVLAAGSTRLDRVDAFAVGVGPGSFTGLRVGLATAKGLAIACEKPLVGVCSLRALARGALDQLRAEPSALVLVAIDAFKGELYAALYARGEAGPDCVLEVFHAAPETAARVLAEALAPYASRALHACGDGARRYAEALSAVPMTLLPEALDRPRGRYVADEALLQLATEGPSDPATLEPRYVRGSDARLPDRPLRVEGS